MIIILVVLMLIVFSVAAGKIILSVQFDKEVKQLFLQSDRVLAKRFDYSQLQGLPEPVQRYFKHVLKEGQPYISYVRLTHDGQFKTDPKQNWIPIKGEQYFTTAKPGFIWKGSTRMFTAKDMFLSEKGRLVVSLLSAFKISDGQGEKYDQGELLRWLGESVWFPTNLLPNENLQWIAIDDQTAQLVFTYNDLSVLYWVSFNESGEITALRTNRYMGEDSLETWVGSVSDYKDINGVKIPVTIEAAYMLKDGKYTYAKFNVNRIEYDIPEKFK